MVSRHSFPKHSPCHNSLTRLFLPWTFPVTTPPGYSSPGHTSPLTFSPASVLPPIPRVIKIKYHRNNGIRIAGTGDFNINVVETTHILCVLSYFAINNAKIVYHVAGSKSPFCNAQTKIEAKFCTFHPFCKN